MSENFSFNKYSKRVKFAYTRWQKRFSSTNDITEQAIFCCEFIIYVSDCCNKSDINDFCEIINTVWQQIYGQFNDKQNKDWETAKKFVECQYLNEAERETISNAEALLSRSNNNDNYFLIDFLPLRASLKALISFEVPTT